MKKVILSLAVVAMGFSFTSCKKCGKCVYENGIDSGVEYCQKDSKVLYDAAKNGCEASGGKWE